MNSDRKLIEIVLNEHLVLKISAKSSNSLFEVDDATEHLEARYQLIEGCSYDYAIVGTNSESYVLDHPSVYPSTISRDRGIIAPNIYVGHLIIPVYNELTSTHLQIIILLHQIQQYRIGYA